MPTPISNTFTTHQLTREEELAAKNLPSLALLELQNVRARIAEEKLNLVFTPNDVQDYAMQVAYKQGQLDILQYLIDEAEVSQTTPLTEQEN